MNIKEELEIRYSKLNEIEKEQLINKDKKSNLLLNILLTSFWGAIAILCYVLIFCLKNDWLVFLINGVFSTIMALSFCLAFILRNKVTDEKRIKRQLEYKIRQENYNKQNLFLDNDIKSVTIIDSYTEVSDKLHAILNYQEIIQTRYYKFKVDYKDGSSTIITAKEGSVKCNNLLKLVNTDSDLETKHQIEPTEELRKYKKLLDEGIITQEEFEQKKKQILGL